MKKTLLLSLAALAAISASAQTATPVVEATVSKVDTTYTFSLGSSAAGTAFTVDWGDGNVVEGATTTAAYDGWDGDVEITGTAKGTIKIYATGALTHLDCVNKSATGAAGLTSLDISNAKDITALEANGNYLTTFDFSQNAALAEVYLNNNSLTSVKINSAVTYLNLQNNKLTSFDGSNAAGLTSLYLSDNNLGALDLSKNLSLKSIYALNAGLTSLNLGANATRSLYVSVNNNPGLTTLDVTEATGLGNRGRLFAVNCNLTELKYSSIATANLSNNKFTLATLPTANISTLTYAPQQDLQIADINGTIDLSSQATVGDSATVYTWYNGETALTEGTDYTADNGKFTFLKDFDAVYCTMSNGALPKFSGSNIFKTVTVKATAATATAISNITVAEEENAPVYTISGVRVNGKNLPAGLYIKNGKKFIVK